MISTELEPVMGLHLDEQISYPALTTRQRDQEVLRDTYEDHQFGPETRSSRSR